MGDWLKRRELIALCPGPAGDVCLLLHDGPRAFGPHDYVVLRVVGDAVDEALQVEAREELFDFVQPLPGGRWLLGSRCGRVVGGGAWERNGVLVGSDGVELGSFVLGDGVTALQASDDGHVWVGYDEDGTQRWHPAIGRGPGGPGIVRMDERGTVEWTFEPPAGLGAVFSCDALNAMGRRHAWACYNPDFPIVRIHRSGVSQWWPSPVHHSHAFAVDFPHVLFFGGHEQEDATLVVLEEGAASLRARVALVDWDGLRIEAGRFAARGGGGVALRGERVCSISVRQVVEAVGAS